MFRNLLFLFGLVVSLHGPADAQNRAASEDWVTNRLTKALAPVAASVVELWDTVGSATSVVYLATQTLARVESQAESNRNAIAAIPPPSTDAWRLITPAGTEWQDATGAVWQITYEVETNVICTFSTPFGKMTAPDYYDRPSELEYVSAPNTQVNAENDWYINFNSASDGLWNVFNYYWGIYWVAEGYELPLVAVGGMGECFGTATFDYVFTTTAVTSRVDTVALQSDLAAATNALIQTYLITSNAWLSSNFSNQTLSVSIVSTNGTTNTVTVGGNNSIDPQATNLLWLALASGLSDKAPKAWGDYAPDGSANPDPSYMTFMNAPATLFASGCSWSSSGSYAVLISTGTVAYASGSNGVFRIGPDYTNYFGYAVGGSVTVGAVPDSIHVTTGGATNGYAEITYLYTVGDYPAMWFTPSLAVDFSLVADPAWVDNLDGTATVTVPATSPHGFWKATTTATFNNTFETTMPAKFLGGVIGSTNALPVVYDSVITVTSGGNNYRIPAQRIE